MSWDAPSLLSGWRKGLVLLLVLIILAGAYVIVQAARSVPRPSLRLAVQSQVVIPGTPPTLPWPSTGESAVDVAGIGRVGAVGGDKPIAIGSVAKIMTAYIILHDHPLSPGQQGPSIPVTAADVATYQADASQGDSVVAVVAGQSLTELQAIQALLVPSGDNIASLLAAWDAGTEAAFVTKMNTTAAALGMDHTHYADVSGLLPTTASTPNDQLILAPLAMANATFAATVASPQITLPTAGLLNNYNSLLGSDGIIGIKTGSVTTGDLVFAARHKVGGKSVTIYGAVLGVAPSATGQGLIEAATAASQKLVVAVEKAVTPITVLPSGSVEAQVRAPWLTSSAPAATAGPLTLLGWPGLQVHLSVAPSGPIARGAGLGTVVGRVTARVGSQQTSTNLRTTAALPKPSLSWRLTRL